MSSKSENGFCRSNAVLAVFLLLYFSVLVCFFWWIGDRIFQYQEGWNTFYFSKYYVADVFSREGVSALIRAFFLQFYAVPVHGALIMSLAMTSVAILLMWCERKCLGMTKLPIVSVVLSVVLSVLFAMFVGNMSFNRTLCLLGNEGKQDEFFMRLSNDVRAEQWDDVVGECEANSPINNLLHQNCLNIALAEKGTLGDRLLEQPVVNIASIYVNVISSPQVAALLSDVYYSMGHIAQSQRYAFEANEKMNNLSPRLLQRLIKTNIIYGQYNVAKKYLRILSKTIYYKDWCERYSALLSDKAVESDAELSVKRKCLIADNRFSGVRGLDDDLLHVARATKGTPQCRTTLQFLGSLYILADYKEQFAAMIDEFRGTDELPSPLPDCFNRFYNHLKMSND